MDSIQYNKQQLKISLKIASLFYSEKNAKYETN